MIRPEDVRIDGSFRARGEVLEVLSDLLAARIDSDRQTILDALWQRERLGSTALGRGVALPHARMRDLDAPAAALLVLRVPLAFDAPDGEPVRIVLGLLLPHREPGRQLELLAAVASCLADENVRQSVVEARDTRRIAHLLDACLRY